MGGACVRLSASTKGHWHDKLLDKTCQTSAKDRIWPYPIQSVLISRRLEACGSCSGNYGSPLSREVRLIYSCIMLRDSWSAPKTRWTSVGLLVRRPVGPQSRWSAGPLPFPTTLLGLRPPPGGRTMVSGLVLSALSTERKLVTVGCDSVNIRCE